ncbi:sarcosine oxidase subunit gamma [Pseudaminobacter sp. 19-2017]|uniref:Sarcosine oxidase subunit gamma n=1 Tax=Pseudaminobacter soli (ex Zhang et al. 2022) TaxID=2831468 RepID=A0A942DZN1_9HYPH|nr:sarcosine oxidase subunit gamma [Pseudaminobacter soli]
MAEFAWKSRSPLAHAVEPGRAGARAGAAGVTLTEIRDFALVQVMARRGTWAETARVAQQLWGIDAPGGPKAVFGQDVTLVGSGPDQFFVLSKGSSVQDPVEPLKQAFAGIASMTDQSDGRCMISLSGPRVRDTLAKFCSLDLHDSVFPVGAAAATSVDHSAVTLWRAPNADGGSPLYNLLVFTSFADSIWHLITESAAEYGAELGYAA